MKKKLAIAGLCCAAVVAVALAVWSEGTVEVSKSTEGDLVLTLSEPDRSALAPGDSLRKAWKYREAIEAYKEALNTTSVDNVIRAEVEYNIGLSYTWLGEYDKAELVFEKMLSTYKDPNVIGYAELCI